VPSTHHKAPCGLSTWGFLFFITSRPVPNEAEHRYQAPPGLGGACPAPPGGVLGDYALNSRDDDRGTFYCLSGSENSPLPSLPFERSENYWVSCSVSGRQFSSLRSSNDKITTAVLFTVRAGARTITLVLISAFSSSRDGTACVLSNDKNKPLHQCYCQN
jgi:hypothetical protein